MAIFPALQKLTHVYIYVFVNKNKEIYHGGLILSWCMFCIYVGNSDDMVLMIFKVVVVVALAVKWSRWRQVLWPRVGSGGEAMGWHGFQHQVCLSCQTYLFLSLTITINVWLSLTPSLLPDSCRKTSTCCKSTWYSARLHDWRQRSSYIHDNHKKLLSAAQILNLQIALHTEAFLSGRLSERWPSLFNFDAVLCSKKNMLVWPLSCSLYMLMPS